jgi:chitin synthase
MHQLIHLENMSPSDSPRRLEKPSPRRRDLESYGQSSPAQGHTPSRSYSQAQLGQSPANYDDKQHLMPVNSPDGIVRKKSLVRHDRRPDDPNQRDYYYRKHAQRMDVHPSTTGNDPTAEEEINTISSASTDRKSLKPHEYENEKRRKNTTTTIREKEPATKLRKGTRETHKEEELRKSRERAAVASISVWVSYCRLVTFWCPDALLRCFGMPSKPQQRAWREKMGLISIIVFVCTFVGYLTFGFTQTVCPPGANQRLRVNNVDTGYMIFHGKAYNLANSTHPLARGIQAGANVVFDLGEGGKDGSFLFQNVNGACKDLITKKDTSSMPSNSQNDLAWYFPCVTINQDGSTQPNFTAPPYLGYQCHTSNNARNTFYGLRSYGDVFFTWNDVRNASRNLMVYKSDVLDLDVLKWFNTTDVSYPSDFDAIRTNPALRGQDVTASFTSERDRQIGNCLTQIIRVGSVDTETIGCIASKVVLYVSLIFILSIVVSKFGLALWYQWFQAKTYGAQKTSFGKLGDKKRQQQIEDWSDDIYRQAPPKFNDNGMGGDRNSKRGSVLFPRTSRFTSPYEVERHSIRSREPTTMANQSTVRGSMYKQMNRSEATLDALGRPSMMDSRSSIMLGSGMDSEGPAGFIHEAVVPQPPADYQPFGFPLVHAICLVTAYSEGADGIRSTLDSVARTEYPNSHKLILIICDGVVKGDGESRSTPDICLSMMKDNAIAPHDVTAYSYVAVASGSKRHNMARIHAGFYDYGRDSKVPVEDQRRVPMMIIEKCGTEDEAKSGKPGNRGKRDSQIMLMGFLQKVMFDERMTELEYEMFNGIWRVTGISPDFYEVVLMVDADTKVFPDSLTHMSAAMVKDPDIMGLCGETKIANKRESWVTMIQVFEYFISHHLSKSFESVFGGVTCLPGCFCMYRIKAPKGAPNHWVPILANPDVVEHYSENVVDTLHKKNLLLLGEDRYLSTLMLKTFPKRKQVFVPQAVCKTTVPEQFGILLSQRRRWINSTVHNLMELVLVRDLCGTFCFSMQFVVFIELIGTLVLPAAISFTIYLIAISIKAAVTHTAAPVIPLILLALILGLPAILIVVTAHRWSYVGWMFIYLLSLPIWNFVLPTYSFWKFDDFSWGQTRKTAGEKTEQGGYVYEGEFDSSKITMKRWADFEKGTLFFLSPST